MIKAFLVSVFILACTALPLNKSHAVGTAQIMQSTLSPSCMGWQVVGACFWLKCVLIKCSVKTSMKVKHFIPEVVVSSYMNTGANPWTDVASYSQPNGTAQAGGNMITPSQKRDNLPRFKNADAIGHPGSFMLNNMGDYICDSATTGFMPYYLSTLDTTAWRYGVPESLYPAALIPGMREISSKTNNWGSVYPRQGFLVQPDDGKAGAVMAQRAADFVVRTGQPHVYLSISARAKEQDGWWPPATAPAGYQAEDPIKEGDITTHKWQQLHPSVSNACTVFPTGSTATQSELGDYAWALWRPYRCCEPKGAFLFSVGH